MKKHTMSFVAGLLTGAMLFGGCTHQRMFRTSRTQVTSVIRLSLVRSSREKSVSSICPTKKTSYVLVPSWVVYVIWSPVFKVWILPK